MGNKKDNRLCHSGLEYTGDLHRRVEVYEDIEVRLIENNLCCTYFGIKGDQQPVTNL